MTDVLCGMYSAGGTVRPDEMEIDMLMNDVLTSSYFERKPAKLASFNVNIRACICASTLCKSPNTIKVTPIRYEGRQGQRGQHYVCGQRKKL